MPLSWNEIRVRAIQFTKDWKDAHYEKGETQTFYNEFFEVFGNRRRNVAAYEEKVKKLNDKSGFIDLFWPGYLLVEQKSADRNLDDARKQATDYFLALSELEKPRYILLSNFQTFELLDLESNPDLVSMNPDIAAQILVRGMRDGSFRGQNKLRQYIN